MNLKDYLGGVRGAQARLASRTGLAPAYVWQMSHGVRPVPVEHCAAIERATGGRVSRRDLRPDDWHLIWPELAQSQCVGEGA